MKEKILDKLTIKENEKELFNKLKENYYITDKLFYKNGNLYSIKIIYKNNKIEYQLKQNKKIILKTNYENTIKNKILKVLEGVKNYV